VVVSRSPAISGEGSRAVSGESIQRCNCFRYDVYSNCYHCAGAEIVTLPIVRANLRGSRTEGRRSGRHAGGAGYRTIPGELMNVSGRLTELREALERVSGQAR
jgi:hypothetical protein